MDLRQAVSQAQHGDHAAFEELVRHAIGRQDALARLVLRDPDLARDAVQNALIRAWRDLPGLRDPERFDAWIYRLTLRSCIDEARRRRRRLVEVELPASAPAGPGDIAQQVVDRDALEAAFEALDPDHRALVLMHVHLGIPLPEAARELGIPLGTAKSRVHRALLQMRAAVEPPTASGQPEGIA